MVNSNSPRLRPIRLRLPRTHATRVRARALHPTQALLQWRVNAGHIGDAQAAQRLREQRLQSWALARPATLARFAAALEARMKPRTDPDPDPNPNPIPNPTPTPTPIPYPYP